MLTDEEIRRWLEASRIIGMAVRRTVDDTTYINLLKRLRDKEGQEFITAVGCFGIGSSHIHVYHAFWGDVYITTHTDRRQSHV